MSNIPSREEALFADALRQPPAQRKAFLAQACGDDLDLLAHLVALVAAHEGPETLMVPAAIAPKRPAVLPDEKPGDWIGRYKLLQKIGEGGCGLVWMAEQEEPVRRRVALKVIKLGMDTKAVIARFEAERQALAMMDHPNIAKVLDAGATNTGRPFFVMELVRGIPITKYCDEHQLAPRERLELFIKVCHAIQHAHQKGVIHRDIKPSNILVTVNDGTPTPKVIDFGIAKATQGRLTDATIFTAFEQFIGTPVYMSPEQATMSSLDIDTRSDIYSLGVLLYELLTGRPPFDAKVFAKAGVDEIRQHIREAEPRTPSSRLLTLGENERTTIARLRNTAPAQLSLLLRGDLDWIVMRCLEKDRSRRYETANGLAMDIQRHLHNEPVAARPPSTAYLLQKLIRRHRLAFSAGAVIFGVVSVGAIVSTWQAVRATRAEHEQIHLREAAQHAQAKETTLRLSAETQERATRRRAYAADMNIVQQAIARGDLGRATRILDRQRPKPGELDLRGWEWRYLWQQCRSEAVATFEPRPNAILSLSVSPEGSLLAMGEREDGGLTVINLQTRAETRLPAGNGQVRVAFSPREPVLAVAIVELHHKFVVLLLSTSTFEIVRRLPLDQLCTGLFFSEDGQRLITSSSEITTWRVSDGTKLKAYPLLSLALEMHYPVAVSRDLTGAVEATPQSLIRAIDLGTGQPRWVANATLERVRAVAISPDGKLVATGAGYFDRSIRLWDLDTGSEIRRLEGHQGWVCALVFWPDGKTLASASADQTIRIWDTRDGRLLRTLRGHRLEVWSLALLPDQRTLASGSKDGSVLLWDTASPTPPNSHIELPTRVASWRFLPDSKSILTLDREGHVERWHGKAFQERNAVLDVGEPCEPWLNGFSRDAPFLAIGREDGSVTVWDWERRAVVSKLRTSGREPHPLFFAADTKLIVADNSAHESNLSEWDLATGLKTRSWPVPFDSLGYSPDQRRWLAINWDGTDSHIDMTTGQVTTPRLNFRGSFGVTFSPNGKLIAASNTLGAVRIWDAATLNEVATVSGFMNSANSPLFSPDGTRLLAGGGDVEAVKFWDVGSYEEVLTLAGHGSVFGSASFSPDGTTLGAVGGFGELNLWRAPSWAEIETVEKTQHATSPKP